MAEEESLDWKEQYEETLTKLKQLEVEQKDGNVYLFVFNPKKYKI
jgi:hypothetical protein